MARDVIECEWGALRGDTRPFVVGALLTLCGLSVLAFLGSALLFGKGGSWTATGVALGFVALGSVVLLFRGGTRVDRARRLVRSYWAFGPQELGGHELPFESFHGVEVERITSNDPTTVFEVRVVGVGSKWLGRYDAPTAAAQQARVVSEFMGLPLDGPSDLVRAPLATRLPDEEEGATPQRERLVVNLDAPKVVVTPRAARGGPAPSGS